MKINILNSYESQIQNWKSSLIEIMAVFWLLESI